MLSKTVSAVFPWLSDLHALFLTGVGVLQLCFWRGEVLQFISAILICGPNFCGCFLVLQDLLKLMAGIIRLAGEGTLWDLNAQDICHHIGSEPANQWCASRGVVGLLVVEKKPVHLE